MMAETGVNRQQIFLGEYAAAHRARLAAWERESVPSRLWQRDPTLWVKDPRAAAAAPELGNRLGWLELPRTMTAAAAALPAFAAEIREAGFSDVVLLGMGGSSLAPQVMRAVFGRPAGFPAFHVLDSTHPEMVRAIAARLPLSRTLFLVASKSGGTIETLSFFRYFYARAVAELENPGRHFVALTDPGSRLQALAAEKNFRRVFSTPPEVGGRYSVLTYFGLLPAALMGIDVDQALARAARMLAAAGPTVPAAANPALELGAALGELALAGRNKMILVADPPLDAFGDWVEQLVAESTGKEGRGIVPVVGEPLIADPAAYGRDCYFVSLEFSGAKPAAAAALDVLKAAGYPVIRLTLGDHLDLFQEFYRWEMATAMAGAVLGINPFNQPNVEAAKRKARELMAAAGREGGGLPAPEPLLAAGELQLFAPAPLVATELPTALEAFLGRVTVGDYLALMAYLPSFPEITGRLQQLRERLRRRCRVVTTLGYGPRFLHSTGQLHKGDGNQGVFLQLTADIDRDLEIPGEAYSFGLLLAAQAQGDFQALAENGRRLLRLHLGSDPRIGLERLLALLPD